MELIGGREINNWPRTSLATTLATGKKSIIQFGINILRAFPECILYFSHKHNQFQMIHMTCATVGTALLSSPSNSNQRKKIHRKYANQQCPSPLRQEEILFLMTF